MKRPLKFRLIHNGHVIGYEEWKDDHTGKYWAYTLIPRAASGPGGPSGTSTKSPIFHSKDQFTGMYDKNKKEVYENDILSYFNSNVRKTHPNHLRKCYWSPQRASFMLQKLGYDELTHSTFREMKMLHYEVIGNTHQSTKLINQ